MVFFVKLHDLIDDLIFIRHIFNNKSLFSVMILISFKSFFGDFPTPACSTKPFHHIHKLPSRTSGLFRFFVLKSVAVLVL